MFKISKKIYSAFEQNAFEILHSGLRKIEPDLVISQAVKVKDYSLAINNSNFQIKKNTIFVIGGGKSSISMAASLEKALEDKWELKGVVNSPEYTRTNAITFNQAQHPIPDLNGQKGVTKMFELTKNLTPEDTVICLISSGGSALMPYPVQNVSLEDLQQATDLMLKKGIEVFEIQKIRKHLSQVKGGMLAKHLYPAQIITLIISDLVNPNDVVASGPTEPDDSTFQDALDVIEKYQIESQLPISIVRYLNDGALGNHSETPKKGSNIFTGVSNIVLADYNVALASMGNTAKQLGYKSIIRSSPLLGEIGEQTRLVANEIIDLACSKNVPVAYIYNSEMTVNVKGNGEGGRCQEHIIRLAQILKNKFRYTLLSIGSDGIDHTHKAAGAIVDQNTYQAWLNSKLDISKFINDNDSYNLLKTTNSIIEGKKTGTSVGDLHLCLLH